MAIIPTVLSFQSITCVLSLPWLYSISNSNFLHAYTPITTESEIWIIRLLSNQFIVFSYNHRPYHPYVNSVDLDFN